MRSIARWGSILISFWETGGVILGDLWGILKSFWDTFGVLGGPGGTSGQSLGPSSDFYDFLRILGCLRGSLLGYISGFSVEKSTTAPIFARCLDVQVLSRRFKRFFVDFVQR